ncbi:MAG: hypothetical protein RIS90_1832 [Pseudomonadota bacterium]|jgi:uncharacterized protein
MTLDCTPPPLDVQAFAEAATLRSGCDTLSNYERLMQETQGLGGDRPLDWAAQGELRTDAVGASQAWLHLTVAAKLPLTCQRCLGPADIAVSVDRWFRFVATEAVAEALDDDAEEDLLVTSRQFNLAELIEDELLLGLPLVPRHDQCPAGLTMSVADPGFEAELSDKPHPFAALARLRAGGPG